MNIVTQHTNCSAGFTYMQIGSNGNIGKCMRNLREQKSTFNIKDIKSINDLNDMQDNITHKCELTCDMFCDKEWCFHWTREKVKNGWAYISRFGNIRQDDILSNRYENIHVVIYPTYKCKYDCLYCDVHSYNEIFGSHYTEELPNEEWIRFIDIINEKYKKIMLSISGGEPFERSDIICDIVKRYPDFYISIVSNLSNPILDFVKSVKNHGNIFINGSIHPTSKHFNFDIFLGRAILLKESGFNISVSLVGYPEQLWLFNRYKEIFDNYQIGFVVQVCEGMGDFVLPKNIENIYGVYGDYSPC